MKQNPVLNFSWRTNRADLPGVKGPVVEIDSSLPAVEAARIAARDSLTILVVRDRNQQTLGVFLPDYLKQALPGHPLTKAIGVDLDESADLAEMIEAIDAANLDFHSELVNVVPNLRLCPEGHLVAAHFCQTHGKLTSPYP